MTQEIQIGKIYKYARGFVFVEGIKEDRFSYGGSSVIYRYLGQAYNIEKELDIGYASNDWKEVRDDNKNK